MSAKTKRGGTSDKGDEIALNIRGIPRQLSNQFQAACVLRGRSMKEVVIELLKEYVVRANKVDTKQRG